MRLIVDLLLLATTQPIGRAKRTRRHEIKMASPALEFD
jgi:hypothetical protein